MEAVRLSTIEEALNFLKSADSLNNGSLNFEGELKTLEIEIEGPLFRGEITGELARGLAELQEELYRAARFAITGKTGRESRLTNEQKKQLELRIDVQKGCTLIKIDAGKFGEGLLNILGDRLNNMTAAEVQVLVVSILAILAIGWIGKNYVVEHFKYKAKKAELETAAAQSESIGEQHSNQMATVTAAATAQAEAAANAQVQIVEQLAAVIAQDRKVERFAEATAAGLTQVTVRATDATSVRVGRIELDEDELATLRRRAPKTTSETLHETGAFRVLTADGSGTQFKLTLGGAAIPGEFTVEYDRTDFSSAEDQMIWDALRDQTEVRLEVKAEQLRDKIKGAVIVSINPI
ncbi:hypothetical protein [Alicycliphilus denitrificans]|uniref:hypothetical protein n=1 Tax=Alicycliphilus denitrificans TaxID=179636 RepID=UPI0016047280|nr:hypothetical protein [Alicycliphilus denitrificans]